MQYYDFTDGKTLTQYFVQRLSSDLQEAIKLRGHAYFVVSGGKTPLALFKCLAKTKLPWSKITITLTDERCLAPTDKNTNEYLVRGTLLQHEAQAANFISLLEDDIEARLALIPVFDAVILGMGEDGHTASLFPCSDNIEQALVTRSNIIRITPKTAPYQRVSLTKHRLLNTRSIYLHLLGDNKREVFEQATLGKDEIAMPIRAFLNSANLQVLFAP